ncbi:protein-L-isoaspartate O-methyltransferase [Nocardioides sp. BGMRC 2183]|nr:protein-L-isoaspartate O-methyltransferase [Nocardioides sp. BGMRC 2183]
MGAEQRAREAMAAVPRGGFLPRRQRRYADEDRPLPIGHGSTCSQPTTVLHLLTALGARPGDRVLDIGSGSGWTTAILAHQVGAGGRVLGVERIAALVARSRESLEIAPGHRAQIVEARPGVLGWPEEAPYDRILVSAAAEAVPQSLVEQLAPDGVLVGPFGGQLCRVTRSEDGEQHVQRRGYYSFVPLVQE